MNQSPWRSKHDLWAQKTGIVPDGLEETEYMKWGKLLEPLVCDEYMERSGTKPVIDVSDHLVRRPDMPWVIAHPDRIVECPDRGPGVVEAKCASAWVSGKWKEEAPVPYQIQLMHNIAACAPEHGTTWGAIPVLIGGNQFVYVEMEVNVRFTAVLLEEEDRFWNEFVVPNVAPPIENDPIEAAVLAAMFPNEEPDSVVELPLESLALDERDREISALVKELGEEQDVIRSKLKAMIGDKQIGMLPSGSGRWSWKTQKRKESVRTIKAWSGRVLRRLK